MDIYHGHIQAFHPHPVTVEDCLEAVSDMDNPPMLGPIRWTHQKLIHPATIAVHWQGFDSPSTGHHAFRDVFTHSHDLYQLRLVGRDVTSPFYEIYAQ